MTVDLNAAQNVITVPTYASYAALIAALPAGTAGRQAMVTASDWERGLWEDNGTSWEPVGSYAPKNVSALPTAARSGQRVILTPGGVGVLRGPYRDERYGWVHEGLNMANVLDYGAYGLGRGVSGAGYPLSTRYSTAADAQAAFPRAHAYLQSFATPQSLALTDQIDWAAITEALQGNQMCYLPPNATFAINRPIVIPNNVSLFSLSQNAQSLAADITAVSGYSYPNMIQNWREDLTTAGGAPNGVNGNAYISLYNVNLDIQDVTIQHGIHFAYLDANSLVENISVDVTESAGQTCDVQTAVMRFSQSGSQNFIVRNLNLVHLTGTPSITRLLQVDVSSGFTLEKANLTTNAVTAANDSVYIGCGAGYATLRDVSFEGSVADQPILYLTGLGLHVVENCQFKCTTDGSVGIEINGASSWKPYLLKGVVFTVRETESRWKWLVDMSVTGQNDINIGIEGIAPTHANSYEVNTIMYWDGHHLSLLKDGGASAAEQRETVQYFGSLRHVYLNIFSAPKGGVFALGDIIWTADARLAYVCTTAGTAGTKENWTSGNAYVAGEWVLNTAGGGGDDQYYRCLKPHTAAAGNRPDVVLATPVWLAASTGTAAAVFKSIPLARLFNVTQGEATVAAGATTETVTHNLGTTPPAGAISITPRSAWGSSTTWWVDTIGATTFRINVNLAPGGAGLLFAWTAKGG